VTARETLRAAADALSSTLAELASAESERDTAREQCVAKDAEIQQRVIDLVGKDAVIAGLQSQNRELYDRFEAGQAEIARLTALLPKPFPLFDATRDGLLPELEFAGLIPESEFFNGSARGALNAEYVGLHTLPEWFREHPNAARVMPDIEFYWSSGVTANEVETVPLPAVRAIKAYRPGIKVGTYSPIERSLNHLTGGASQIVPRTDAWYQRNTVYLPLYAELDEFWVSLYCIVKDAYLAGATAIPNIEEDYIASNLAMARRFSGNKPVYAVLCPYFHPTSGRTGLFPLDRWQKYVSLCRKLADGIAIWTDVNTNPADIAAHMAVLKAA
jgi:hypothetical protein